MSKPSYTILIAEDDFRTRTALANSLKNVGYQVIAVADGQEAVDSFRAAAEDIDLVVLDVLMPKLDGLQVCQALRAVSDVPIILATVLGSSSDRVTGLEMGANDYIGSHHLRLTEIEFRLLSLLASKPGHIFSRGDILQSLWGYDASSASDTKTVDVHISRLRIKLNDTARDPKFIVTIRGRGYMFLIQR